MPRDLFADLEEMKEPQNQQDLLAGMSNIQEKDLDNRSFLSKLPANIAAGLGQLGHELINAPHNQWAMISPEIAKYIPMQKEHDYSKMLGLPGTTADKIVQGIVSNAPFLAAPEADLGMIGKAISGIPKAGKFLEGALSRAVPQAALGSALSEDPMKGGLTAGGTQLGLEAITAPFKSIRPLAELFNPMKAAQNELGNIRNSYQVAESAKNEAYKPFNQISKDYKVENPKNYRDTIEDNKSYFGPQINRLDEKFSKDPTLENAHKLQSKMFTRMKQEYKKADPDYDKIEALKESRDAINKDLINKLNRIDKNVASSYKEGARIHKQEIEPYFSNSKIANLVEGDIQNVNPQDILSAIKPAKEENKIPKEHYLREALNNMQSKLYKAKAAQFAIPMLAGGVAGELLHPGLTGIGSGLTAGLVAGGASPRLAEFIQNPEISKIIERLKRTKNIASPIYYGGGRELSRSMNE